MKFDFTLNGKAVSIDVDAATPLLEVLRNDIKLNGPKFGCGLAQCGACAVLLDGTSVRSCVLPIKNIAGKAITTLEGIGNEKNPHPLQKTFIELQALQCGYCTSGIITTAAALLERNPEPSIDDIKTALKDHLCRCGAQPRIIRAVHEAAKRMASST